MTTETMKNDTINPSMSSRAKKAAADLTDGTSFDRRELKLIAADAGKKVADFIHARSEQAHDMRVKAEDSVKQNPVRSLAIAAVGGLLLGAFLGRR